MIELPSALADTQRAEDGAWVRNLSTLVEEMLSRWSLRPNSACPTKQTRVSNRHDR